MMMHHPCRLLCSCLQVIVRQAVYAVRGHLLLVALYHRCDFVRNSELTAA